MYIIRSKLINLSFFIIYVYAVFMYFIIPKELFYFF